MRGPQLRNLVEYHPAKMYLDYCRSIVRDHRAQVFKPAARHHDGGHTYNRQDQIVKGRPGENPGDQPAQQSQARDTKEHGHNADRHCAKNAQTHTPGKTP